MLDRPTDDYIRKLEHLWEASPVAHDGESDIRGIWGQEGEDEEHLWWHQTGRLVKRSRTA